QSRLPGFRYDGPRPEDYMTAAETADYLDRYARSFRAPLETGTNVLGVARSSGGYRVATDRGDWQSDAVVVATGHCDTPYVPAVSNDLPLDVLQVVPSVYKKPAQLPRGGGLIVGASSSGVQLAEEIHASGRPVTLAVGRHTRLPRVHRGRDIMWWLDASGILDETLDEVRDVAAARRQPSLQLIGRSVRDTLDL